MNEVIIAIILGVIFLVGAVIPMTIIDFFDDLHRRRRECDWRCEQMRKRKN